MENSLIRSLFLSALKWAYPWLDREPRVLWPVVVFVLARGGLAVCTSLGGTCTGNPLQWGTPTMSALAITALAMVARDVLHDLAAWKARPSALSKPAN